MATTLLNAASTTGAGTALSCSSVDKAVLTVTTSQYFSGNVVFEATIDGSTWFPYSGVLVGTKNVVDMVTGANSTRAISFDVSGLVQLRPNIKSISAGTATVVGNTVASSTSLAGRRVTLSMGTYDQALNVAAGAATTITITPPAGELWHVKVLRMDVPAPAGASAGTHTVNVRAGVNNDGGTILYLASNFGDVVRFLYNVAISATATNGKFPTSEQAQQGAVLGLEVSNSSPLYVTYTNNTTGGTQSGTFTLRILKEVEYIAS